MSMFARSVFQYLDYWAASKDRKPLILRGARQVGKTTAINLWSQHFDTYLYFNLDNREDLRLFEQAESIDLLIEALFFSRNKLRNSGRILIFIDEIQNSSKAIAWLRYFYEESPDLFVVAAGSLLESLLDKQISFPIGRVEYAILRPLSFAEFLIAMREEQALIALQKVPLPTYAHDSLMTLFSKYMLIGGMPEAVANYTEYIDLVRLKPIFDNLLIGYQDDVEKYANRPSQVPLLRHVIATVFSEAGKRIKYHGFGNSNYGSKDMRASLEMLEKSFLIQLIFPTTDVTMPALPSKRKSPKLQVLDTGLLLHTAGLQGRLLVGGVTNIVWKGTMVEHLVGQELLTQYTSPMDKLQFWVKEKKQSNAEVDYILPTEYGLLPIEVKSGAVGRLRSLHQFMDLADHHWAVRFYDGLVQLDQVKTIAGKPFHLMSLPYCLAGQLDEYLNWFFSEVKI